jgi:hypothetical protein
MRLLIASALTFAVLLPFASVNASPPKADTAAPAKMPAAAESPDANAVALSGKVVETMNAGGYTYVLIEKKGKKTWVAVPETKVTVGQQIAFEPGQEMKSFKSNTLKRTFDSIIFSAGVSSAADNGNKAQHHGSKSSAGKTTEKISVEKAMGPDSYTVGEIFIQGNKLDKKSAVVKAKVVKVATGIMGKNWIHLQDGTGDPSKGANDLIATSQDLPAVGDVITVKGTIYKDKDFGSGYKYDVIMEDAAIQK